MNAQLNYILAQEHIADLQRAAESGRLARDVDPRRRERRLGSDHPLERVLTRLIARVAPDAS